MQRLLNRVHAPASTQALLPLVSDEEAPEEITKMLEKMCPNAVPLWKECNRGNLVLMLWEDKMAACFSCTHCKDEIAGFRSEAIGDTSIVYLHTEKHLSKLIAHTYLTLMCSISKIQCEFKYGVEDLKFADDVLCWGFPHGNHALPEKVSACLIKHDALFLEPPLVLSENRFCCDYGHGVLLITLDKNGLVSDVTTSSCHYTNLIYVDDDTELEDSNSLFVHENEAPQHGTPTLDQFMDSSIVYHVFASNLPIMQTGVQQVAIFPNARIFTFVCADDEAPQRMFILGTLDDKHCLKPDLVLGITPPDAPCIHNIINSVLKGDAELYASAFDARSVINNANYDVITPGTSIHSGKAHDAVIEKGRTFFRNTFANYLHWTSGGRFVCSVKLDDHHTLVIMGAYTMLFFIKLIVLSQLRLWCTSRGRTVPEHRRLFWNTQCMRSQ